MDGTTTKCKKELLDVSVNVHSIQFNGKIIIIVIIIIIIIIIFYCLLNVCLVSNISVLLVIISLDALFMLFMY